jgi:isocitrate dehydrogenase (NAD+)
VILCLNEYGDFLSDMASGLVGSLGTGASGSYSFAPDGSPELALFDPAGGTAPDIAGRGICNPTAALLAFALLLEHREHLEAAAALRGALFGAIAAGEATRDIGGSLGTTAFTAAVVDRIEI